MIDYETFENAFNILYDSTIERNEYLDMYPSDYGAFLVENEYCNSLGMTLDKICATLFGELDDDVNWFLWDRPSDEIGRVIYTPSKNYPVRTKEEFLTFIREVRYNMTEQ